MKKLVFNFHFCLLITMFVFVATQAMAIVGIEVSGQHTVDDSETTQNDERIDITLTYSVIPKPAPTADDFTFIDTQTPVFSDGGDSDLKTYVISQAGSTVTFTLTGYAQVVATGAAAVVTFTSGVSTDNKIEYADGYIPGLGYAIVAKNNTAIAAGVYPSLPTITPPNDIVKLPWPIVDPTLMPDLHAVLLGGGTINLRVNEPGTGRTGNRLGSKTDFDTYEEDHNRNQRQVVINEVMWAYDDSFPPNSDNSVREQWIELYNRTTTPIKWTDVEITVSNAFPGPDPETDMLSNVPTRDNTWEIGNKGQHGRSTEPTREFKSMQRVNYDNGWEAEHWSIATVPYLRNYRGTPGQENRNSTVPIARRRPGQDNPAINRIIINEIGNFDDDTLDWIELRNVTGDTQSLRDWALTKTTGFGNESDLVRFPDISIPARSVLLLVNKNPQDTRLAMGFNVEVDAANQEFGASPHQFLTVADNNIEIPNDDRWLLILRSGKPWDVGNNKNVYETGHRVEDVVGPGALHAEFIVLDINVPSPRWEKKPDGTPDGEIWHTKVFPLNGNLQADADFLQSDRLNEAGKVWVRDGAKQGFLKDAWSQAPFTGIGYDRSVEKIDQYGGTPGYDSSIAKGRLSQLAGDRLIISELMLTTGNRNSPQWIELYNTSKTRGIDLAADSSGQNTGWQLIVENHESGSWKESRRHLNIKIDLKNLFDYIPPNQTVLIVSTKGKNSERDYFPDTRVAGIFEQEKAKFSMANKKDPILNAEGGFYIRIVDGDGTISDEAGNLDGQAPNLRQGIGLDDPFSWNWPTDLTEDGHRTSLIRLKDANGRPRIGVPNRDIEGDLTGAVLPMGKKGRQARYAWIHAVDTKFKRVPREEIWYGDSRDIGTPGFVKGTPLPVNLSFFRPTLENGAVVIRWTTESELDNAGFNIYRSRTRNGEFKQVNTQLIQGAGTTGERQTYKWIDTTAKQGVIYYYQIEDVSFAGERQVLTTTRLKGLISARSKLTTTWSQLKSSR